MNMGTSWNTRCSALRLKTLVLVCGLVGCTDLMAAGCVPAGPTRDLLQVSLESQGETKANHPVAQVALTEQHGRCGAHDDKLPILLLGHKDSGSHSRPKTAVLFNM